MVAAPGVALVAAPGVGLVAAVFGLAALGAAPLAVAAPGPGLLSGVLQGMAASTPGSSWTERQGAVRARNWPTLPSARRLREALGKPARIALMVGSRPTTTLSTVLRLVRMRSI